MGNSLAQHLKRIGQPVRYALDPVHEQAIRNYILLQTRALNVPNDHANARPLLGSLYKQQPIIPQHFAGLMTENDPATLAQYLDLLDEHGDIRFNQQPFNRSSSGFSLQELVDNLHGLRHVLNTEQPNIIKGYSQVALDHPQLRRELGFMLREPVAAGGMTPLEHMRHMLNIPGLHQHPSFMSAQDAMTNLFSNNPDPRHLALFNDVGSEVLHNDKLPAGLGNRGGGVEGVTRSLLADQITPMLDNYGATGTMRRVTNG